MTHFLVWSEPRGSGAEFVIESGVEYELVFSLSKANMLLSSDGKKLLVRMHSLICRKKEIKKLILVWGTDILIHSCSSCRSLNRFVGIVVWDFYRRHVMNFMDNITDDIVPQFVHA